MTLNATNVVPAIFVTAAALVAFFGWCLARISAISDVRERRAWKTLHTMTCHGPRCLGRVWSRDYRDFDPDLGFVFDIERECFACAAEANRGVDIDLDTMTAKDIARAFDREFTGRQVGGSAGPGAA